MAPDRRSLLRRLRLEFFDGSAEWQDVHNVPADAAAEFNSRGKDPQTSLWDEGSEKQTRTDALLGILLSRPVLKSLGVGALWQQGLPTVGSRLVRIDGDTDYRPAIELHFQLGGHTRPADYVEMAFAAGRRNEFEFLNTEVVYRHIEDAILNKRLSFADIRDGLLKTDFIARYNKRNVSVRDARNRLEDHIIIDVRGVRDGNKIPNAREIDRKQIEKTDPPQLPGLKTGDPAIIYCEDEVISRAIARVLCPRYLQLKVLLGGYAAWLEADCPVVARH